jgi:hypothetical protein
MHVGAAMLLPVLVRAAISSTGSHPVPATAAEEVMLTWEMADAAAAGVVDGCHLLRGTWKAEHGAVLHSSDARRK